MGGDHPDYCLNAPGANPILLMWKCEESHPDNIVWEMPENRSGPIRNRNGTKCVDLPNHIAENGRLLQNWDCDHAPAENLGFVVNPLADCRWPDWSDWSDCSGKCGESGKKS